MMTTTIRQLVKVDAGGRVVVQSSELRDGESAEVIFIVERTAPIEIDDRLSSLRRFRQTMNLTADRVA